MERWIDRVERLAWESCLRSRSSLTLERFSFSDPWIHRLPPPPTAPVQHKNARERRDQRASVMPERFNETHSSRRLTNTRIPKISTAARECGTDQELERMMEPSASSSTKRIKKTRKERQGMVDRAMSRHVGAIRILS